MMAGNLPERATCAAASPAADFGLLLNDTGRATLLRSEPKKRGPHYVRYGAASRPWLTDLHGEGTRQIPAIMRAPRSCWLLAAMALTRLVPK